MRNGVEVHGDVCECDAESHNFVHKIPLRFHLGVRHEFCEQLFGIFSEVL
jgi:hypothetical protein